MTRSASYGPLGKHPSLRVAKAALALHVRVAKYRNKPQVVDGIRFASQKEARRDAELQLLERAGKIADLRRQPRFPIVVNGVKVCTYVGDWLYVEHNRAVCEDAKGIQTPAFKLKWKLAKALRPDIEWRLS